jgi:hypothetical protein
MEMNWEKYNKMWIGLALGLVSPWIIWGIYWLIFQRGIHIPKDNVRYVLNQELMINVFKICCGIDLVWFYLSMNRKLIEFAKGIIWSVMIYALILGYMTFF